MINRDTRFFMICDKCHRFWFSTEFRRRCDYCGDTSTRKVIHAAHRLYEQIESALRHEPYTKDGAKSIAKAFKKLCRKEPDYIPCLLKIEELENHYSEFEMKPTMSWCFSGPEPQEELEDVLYGN